MQESLGPTGLERHEPRLYTVAEFRRRAAAVESAGWTMITIVCGEMIGFGAIFAVILHFTGPKPECNVLCVAGLGLNLLTIIVTLFGMGKWLERLRTKEPVTCERCSKQREVAFDMNFAIAIHGCPYCQSALFQEWPDRSAIMALPADTVSGEGEFTFADISEAESKRKRAVRKWLMIAAIPSTVVLVITSAALGVWHDLLMVRFGDLAADVANTIRFIPAFIVLAIGVFWAFYRSHGKFPKCSGCGKGLLDTDRCTQTTGNCTECGRRVIRDAPLFCSDDDSPKYKPIEHAQLAAWSALYHRLVVCLILIMGMGILAWGWLISWWYGFALNQDVSGGFIMVLNAGVFALILALGWVGHFLKHLRCCPHCKGSLLEGTRFIQATRNCCHCGRRVLASAE